MSLVLTVINAFGDYPRGAQITDASKVEAILGSDAAVNVVKSSAAAEAAPAPLPFTEAPDAPAPGAESKPSRG
jgi:hypothetical protein